MKATSVLSISILLLSALLIVAMPEFAFCSVESTLTTIQTRLISTIVPLAAILGLIVAGLSFVAGSPNARGHLWLAILGAIVAFSAPSIIAFIRGMVQ